MSTKFTASRVSKLDPPNDGKNQVFYWDVDPPQLGVRVTQSCNRAYVFQGRASGRSMRMTIGDVGVWSLDDARKEARRLQQLCDQGIDPRRDRAGQSDDNNKFHESQALAAIKFEQVYQEYLAENRSNWSERHYNDHISLARRGGEVKKRGKGLTVRQPIAALLDKPLSSITAQVLADWQSSEVQRPGQAALAFRLVRTFLNYCAEHEVYGQIVDKQVHQAKRVRKAVPTLKPRQKALQRNQIKDWFDAVGSMDNVMHRVFLQIAILTGARSESLRSMKWQDVDFAWKTIKIWDKVEQDYRIIPMTRYVEYLLRQIPVNSHSEFVFWTSRSSTGYISDVRKIYYRYLQEKGLPLVSIHDLRRSFSNLSEWLDVPHGVVAQIMGHKPSATAEKHYKKRPVDLLRLHHQKIEDWILSEAGISCPDQIPDIT